MMASCSAEGQEKMIEDEEGEEGWVDTHHGDDADKAANKVQEMSLGGDEKKDSKVKETQQEDEDQEAVDMEDFIDQGMEDEGVDDSVEVKPKAEEDGAVGGEIVETRTYDLNMTYDKYYQTPRLFLFGYDEKKKPLSVDQMYEDFSADHANKTITMETHPHLPGPPMASVHPCRHAQVMKKLIGQIVEGGGELEVHMYLIVFLKFVQAIIPTIEYDFTQNFAIGKN